MGKVNLKELAEQMDAMMNEWSYFVNKDTGEIITISNEYLAYAEEPEDTPAHLLDWEREEIRQAAGDP